MSQSSQWGNLLRLGYLLLAESSIDILRTKIIATAQSILNCHATLWMAESSVNGLSPFTSPDLSGDYDNDFHSQTAYQSYERKEPIHEEFYVEPTNNIGTQNFCYFVPLLSSTGKVLAVLELFRTKKPDFNRNEIEFANYIAWQASLALQTISSQSTQYQNIQKRLDLAYDVSRQIADIADFDELTRQSAGLILNTLHYPYVCIFETDAQLGLLKSWQISSSILAQNDMPSVISIEFGQGVIGRVAETGQDVRINDISRIPYERTSATLFQAKSEYCVPLKSSGHILGVLDVQSDQTDAFSELDGIILNFLAGSITSTIEKIKLTCNLQHQIDQLASATEIGSSIASILDQDNLLNNVANLIHGRLGYPHVYIYTVHHGLGIIALRACGGLSPSGIEKFNMAINAPKGLIPWVAQNGETVISNNVGADERYFPTELTPSPSGSELIVPLVFGGHILGILDIQSPLLNAFDSQDAFVVSALAASISIAMRNANLYHSEQWRRQVAESMREVAGLLSADISLPDVLARILEVSQDTLPCDVSAIWLFENTSKNSDPEQISPSLHLAAVRVSNELKNSSWQQSEIIESLKGNYELTLPECPWLTTALEDKQPTIRTPDAPYEPLGALLGFIPEYSAIAAPLRIGEQTLGVLVMVHQVTGRYGKESQAMTAAFASYAAVAIENTRLYEAAHDQAWISTVLLQVAEATQSITSKHELLDTVVHIIPELIGVNSCAILMRDKTIGTFIPTSAFGLNQEQFNNFSQWHIKENQISAFDIVLHEKKSLLLDSNNVSPTEKQSHFSAFDLDQDLLVLFPMLVQGEVLGIISVDFKGDNSEDESVFALWEEKLTIIQGIAHQTAISAENLRLLEAQEEEAYISVALLQVAQTVVSTNDLNEILAAIVRITPILVGVKRCAIFLWDIGSSTYHLSASYGISKVDLDLMNEFYHPSEFPLLEAVRISDGLIYHEIKEDQDRPTEWCNLKDQNQLNISTTNLDGTATEHSNIDFYQSSNRLLIGLPLAVKGNVLGVMLTEEENAHGGIPSAYIRTKRLEIVTGITQQAALAVQNDLLQREVVERERLEREMQLAREIQQTFLPDQLPKLPGWDLSIRWRPARQVGGDFYDILELPDGRIGIVIADVADKGMPAALFMTLIRTLIRAAVLTENSPSGILKQVNRLLVPDAKHGMFVTVVYAVLHPDTGRLTYCNAGHNPPIKFQPGSGCISELKNTGMALGVLDNIDLDERSIEIALNECIIFYTDGVTEAYQQSLESTNEDTFFGYERLQHTILSSTPLTADELADEIVKSVDKFIEGTPISDDLTVAILYRNGK